MTLMQQWQYLNLTRNSFYILFPAKGIVSYRQIIYNCLNICLSKTCSLASRALWNTGNKLNNINVNYLKIPKKHCGFAGPHTTLSWVACSLQPVCLRPLPLHIYDTGNEMTNKAKIVHQSVLPTPQNVLPKHVSQIIKVNNKIHKVFSYYLTPCHKICFGLADSVWTRGSVWLSWQVPLYRR